MRSTFSGEPKVVLENKNNMEHWDELKPVFQKFATLFGVDIYVSNPHGEKSKPKKETGKLFVRFWSHPGAGNSFSDEKSELFSCQLLGGQSDGLSVSPIGIPIYDECRTLAADMVDGTLFILFDLPHREGGGPILERILEEYVRAVTEEPEVRKQRLQEISRKQYIEKRKKCARQQSEECKENIEKAERDIKAYQKKIVEVVRTMRHASEKLAFLSGTALVNVERQAESEWEKLIHMPGVEDVCIIDDSISVFLSKEISISFESIEYAIGKFRIDINEEDCDVRAHNLTRCVKNCYHPHVQDNGDCCFGEISDGIAQLIGEYEYAALVQVMMRYLESYNDANPYTSITNFPIVGETSNTKEGD